MNRISITIKVQSLKMVQQIGTHQTIIQDRICFNGVIKSQEKSESDQ